ncbi:hypothetical protein DL764_002385 [Monosporascus ibericus]|uniref:Uncharacterized protein n=1 Tax=Monosporascus ibericus TaxID=155417 RepID=A0A4Q4TLW5_9PEZI|nr:hypothetical protein DL764_002385 [Monosporascus ibericus]
MASRPDNTFNRAVEKFRDSLTEEQKRNFSATNLEDVKSEIQNIQHHLGLEKKLRNLNKVSRFLEAMKQVEQVVNVFLNVHEVVAFIWGPIKLALVVAGTRIDTLERLLDTYVEIGEVIPGLQQYDQLFKNCPAVREILELYLLKRHRTLLSDEKLTAAIAEIQDIRQLAVTRFNEQSVQWNTRFDELSKKLDNRFQELSKQLYEDQEKLAEREAREQQEALRQQRPFIAEKLGPPDYEADQHRASEQRFSASGDWILKDQDFLSWLDPRNPSHRTLFLHGMPGAGMFLYAKVVLDNLMGQGSEAELENELETENFPDGLDSAYVVRVLERPTRSKREAAARILGWITCAARPLRWREIQSRFCINSEQGCCNFKNRRVDSCKILCGSLVEAGQCNWGAGSETEIIVSLVHDTAGKYLIHTGRIRLFEEHTEMAIFCCRYLTSGPFKLGVQERSIRDLALSGYYGFQDYAGAFWHHHIDSVLNLAADLPMQLSEDITRSVFCLLGDYDVMQQTGSTTSDAQPAGTAQQVRKILQELHDNDGQKGSFEERTSAVRRRQDFDLFRILVETAGEQKRPTFLGSSSDPSLTRYIQAAVVNGAAEILKDLLSWYKQNSGAAGDTAWEWVCAENEEGNTLLHIAAGNGDAVILKLLLTTGEVDPYLKNKSGDTPLHWAAQEGHEAIINVLLATGRVDPNSKNESRDNPIHSAVREGHQAVVNVLLATGRVEGEALLHSAAKEGHEAMVSSLLATGKVDPDSKDQFGSTPLHDAASEGHEAIVNTLLATGNVDPSSKNESGGTPLHNAAREGHESIVNILLATGKIHLDLKDQSGSTPLLDAASKGHKAIVNILLATGKVDPNSKNHCGNTPLPSGEELCVLQDDPVDPSGENYIRSVCFSPDGKYLVTGGEDKLIRVWDITSRTIRNTFSDHGQDIYSVHFPGYGRAIASGSGDSAVRVWDFETGRLFRVLSAEDCVMSVAVSPDIKYVAAGLVCTNLRVWNVQTGDLVETLEGAEDHRDSVYSVAFASNGRDLISGNMDKTIKT